MERVSCELIGLDGNIFAVMGRARQALQRAGRREDAQQMIERVRGSKSYDAALGIILEYVRDASEDADE